jgi:hypothetical protein
LPSTSPQTPIPFEVAITAVTPKTTTPIGSIASLRT